jgi:uncharacterized protein (TIGR02444 family)
MDRRSRAPEKPRTGRSFVTARQDPGNPQAGLHQYQNDFWRFSLAVYGQPGVAGECLGLQDKFGLNINLLLFCAWLGRRGIVLTREHLEGASRSIASWHDHVVRPLRGVRQQMKLHHEDVPALKAQVQRVEIEAEQVEQAMLFDYARNITPGGGRDAVARNVNKYLAMMSGAASGLGAPLLVAAARNQKP